MLDIKAIREDFSTVEKRLRTKDSKISLKELILLDQKIRKNKTSVEELKHARNQISKEIGEKKRNKQDASDLMLEVQSIGGKITELDRALRSLKENFDRLFLVLPNLPLEDVPVSDNVEDNQCVKTYGEKPKFDFPIQNHLEIGESLKLFDFARGAKVTGAGWPVYTNRGALLEWALINYMLDTHKKNGFCFVLPPLLARSETMLGSAQLPKFEDQLFKIHDDDFHLYLIPTSEAVLNGLHMDEIIESGDLPIKYVSYTPCFRREAGAAGLQERGLIRNHQFNKVELFGICRPEESEGLFEEILSSAEEVIQGLELHYRNCLLVTKDMSFAAAKTIDIEIWLPAQNQYYEVSSVSNCTDFQARRSQIRFREKDEKPSFVHTLNGSGVATSRLMVSFLESHQKSDGTIHIPKALQPYLKQETL